MADTAPTFTPSPGIPNESHARFWAASAKAGGPAGPTLSAPAQQTPSTASYIASRAMDHEKQNGPSAVPVAKGVTVDTVKAYQESKRNPQPAPTMVLDGSPGQVDRVIAEMRASGQVTGTDTIAAKDALIALKRSTPLDKQTHQWKAEWERKFAAADTHGEKPAASIVPAGTNPEAVQGVDTLMKAMDSAGHAPVASFSKAVTHGYTLPTLVTGQTYDVERLLPELAKARKAGISQAQVDNYIREDMRERGFKV